MQCAISSKYVRTRRKPLRVHSLLASVLFWAIAGSAARGSHNAISVVRSIYSSPLHHREILSHMLNLPFWASNSVHALLLLTTFNSHLMSC